MSKLTKQELRFVNSKLLPALGDNGIEVDSISDDGENQFVSMQTDVSSKKLGRILEDLAEENDFDYTLERDNYKTEDTLLPLLFVNFDNGRRLELTFDRGTDQVEIQLCEDDADDLDLEQDDLDDDFRPTKKETKAQGKGKKPEPEEDEDEEEAPKVRGKAKHVAKPEPEPEEDEDDDTETLPSISVKQIRSAMKKAKNGLLLPDYHVKGKPNEYEVEYSGEKRVLAAALSKVFDSLGAREVQEQEGEFASFAHLDGYYSFTVKPIKGVVHVRMMVTEAEVPEEDEEEENEPALPVVELKPLLTALRKAGITPATSSRIKPDAETVALVSEAANKKEFKKAILAVVDKLGIAEVADPAEIGDGQQYVVLEHGDGYYGFDYKSSRGKVTITLSVLDGVAAEPEEDDEEEEVVSPAKAVVNGKELVAQTRDASIALAALIKEAKAKAAELTAILNKI